MGEHIVDTSTGIGKARFLPDASSVCIDVFSDAYREYQEAQMAHVFELRASGKKPDKSISFETAVLMDDGSVELTVYIGDLKIFSFVFPRGSWVWEKQQ